MTAPYAAIWVSSDKTDSEKKTIPKNSLFLEEPNGLDAPCFSDILTIARSIYLLCKFDIISLRSIAI